MKKCFVWLGILAFVGMLCSCDTKETYHTEQKEPAEEKEESSVAKEVGDVIDYGIGVTQVRALQNSKQQIQQINEQHNKALEEAMEE